MNLPDSSLCARCSSVRPLRAPQSNAAALLHLFGTVVSLVSARVSSGGKVSSLFLREAIPLLVRIPSLKRVGAVLAFQCLVTAATLLGQVVIPAAGYVNTIAGTGTAGYNGDGILATSAELRYPQGIAVDVNGNIYVADESNQRIRKITASTGDISTVAGNGTAGYSGDGGAATSAELDYPIAVALDLLGNLYIADQGNSVIRKVTVATGVISTVAGNGTLGYSGYHSEYDPVLYGGWICGH